MKHRVFLSLLVVLLSFSSCVAWSQEEGVVSVVQEEENSRQLRIIREALLQGSTDDIRVEAAVELLVRNDTASWDVLVAALKMPDNLQADRLFAKHLSKAGGWDKVLLPAGFSLNPSCSFLLHRRLSKRLRRRRHCCFSIFRKSNRD